MHWQNLGIIVILKWNHFLIFLNIPMDWAQNAMWHMIHMQWYVGGTTTELLVTVVAQNWKRLITALHMVRNYWKIIFRSDTFTICRFFFAFLLKRKEIYEIHYVKSQHWLQTAKVFVTQNSNLQHIQLCGVSLHKNYSSQLLSAHDKWCNPLPVGK